MKTFIQRHLLGSGLGPKLLKASAGSAGLRISGMGFSFLVGVQLARGLGAEGFGIYGLAMSIIALLTVPTEFGFPQLVTREVATAHVVGDWGKLRGILRWTTHKALIIALVVDAFVLTGLFVSGRGVVSPLGMTLLVGLLMVPIVAQCNLNSSALRGLQHIVKGQLPDTLLRPASFSLLLFAGSFLVGPLSPPLAMGLGVASASLAYLSAKFLLRKELPRDVLEVNPTIDSSAWWASAFPMALTEGMRLLQGHLVILLLGVLSTAAMVGVYRVAGSVSLLIATPITLFNVVSAPVISRLFAEGDHQRLQRLLIWIAISMFVCVLVLILPFLISGEFLIWSIFGSEFASASNILLILCIGLALNSFFGANAALLNMTGHHVRVTRASGIALIILAVLLPPLIWLAGLEGAAISSSISLGMWNYIMWCDAKRLLSLDTCAGAYFYSKDFA